MPVIGVMPIVGAMPVVWSKASGLLDQIRRCWWLVILAVVLLRSEPDATGMTTIKISLNKVAALGGASSPGVLAVPAPLRSIVVMGGEGREGFAAGTPRSEAPWGSAVFPATFLWSSSSAAPQRPLAVDLDSRRAAAPGIRSMPLLLQPPGQSAKKEALLLHHGVLHLFRPKWFRPRRRSGCPCSEASSHRRWSRTRLQLCFPA